MQKRILFFEEGVRTGGIGEQFGMGLIRAGYQGLYRLYAVEDCFVPQASVERQCALHGLDIEHIIHEVQMTEA